MRLLTRVLVLSMCWLAATGTASAQAAPEREAWKTEYKRPDGIPFPDSDPYSEPKVELGRMLFFDPILSGPGTRSCASCHNPGLSWGDGLAHAVGVGKQPLPQRAPTLLNIAWIPILGWDGKFRDLESVAFGPITAPANMNGDEKQLLARLGAIPGYAKAFASAFGDGGITREHVEQALATFERTIVSPPAPFDRWIAGDETAIDEAAKRGFDLFNSKAGCAECHRGWSFTDGSFYDIGAAEENDLGRGVFFPTSLKLRHAFKVPTLRDAARRAPYLHDGSVATLAEIIDLYDRGGIDRPSRSELIKPLHLTEGEKSDLLAFLKTLTSDPVAAAIPALPR